MLLPAASRDKMECSAYHTDLLRNANETGLPPDGPL